MGNPGRFARTFGTVAAALALGVSAPAARPTQTELAALSPSVADPPEPALRAAQVALEQARAGDPAAAAGKLVQLVPQLEPIADHLALASVRLWIDAKRPRAAEQAARAALLRFPKTPLRGELRAALGDALAARGANEEARAAWQAALAAGLPPEEAARVRLALARSLEASGEPEAAAAVYRTLWVEAAESGEAEQAARRLEDLRRELGHPLLSAADHLARAHRLFEARRNGAALDSVERALQLGLEARAREEAERLRARCLFRLRLYLRAAAAFARLEPEDATRITEARALARAGAGREAIALLESLAERRGPEAPRASLIAAILLAERGERERAEAHLRRAAARGEGPLAAEALWRLAWSAFRRGDRARARRWLGRLEQRAANQAARLRARYWLARTLADEGKRRAALAALAREFPLSYYGWLATRALGSAASLGKGDARAQAEAGAPSGEALRRGPARLGGRALARPELLLALGLREAALAEIQRLEKEAAGLEDWLALARLYADAGAPDQAERVLVARYADILARGPRPGYEELWWLAWPSAQRALLEDGPTEGAKVEPELVLALVREESGYRSDAVSTAGAVGLLQLMPATAQRVAARLGMARFDPATLLEPRTNLKLGSAYLASLLERFDRRLPLAIAAYNAGPSAVRRWRDPPPEREDEWIEAIPYAQTRVYVKRVLRSLHAYRSLY